MNRVEVTPGAIGAYRTWSREVRSWRWKVPRTLNGITWENVLPPELLQDAIQVWGVIQRGAASWRIGGWVNRYQHPDYPVEVVLDDYPQPGDILTLHW